METSSIQNATATVITSAELLEHWQGHRNLTRRTIEAFPDDQLFTFSVGGMRNFGELALELIRMAAPSARGVAFGEWTEEFPGQSDIPKPGTKAEILTLWDASTAYINSVWPQISLERFHEQDKAFGMYDGTVYALFLYIVDNEIHHRAQGYVYLRALGIEPPFFWER